MREQRERLAQVCTAPLLHPSFMIRVHPVEVLLIKLVAQSPHPVSLSPWLVLQGIPEVRRVVAVVEGGAAGGRRRMTQ